MSMRRHEIPAYERLIRDMENTTIMYYQFAYDYDRVVSDSEKYRGSARKLVKELERSRIRYQELLSKQRVGEFTTMDLSELSELSRRPEVTSDELYRLIFTDIKRRLHDFELIITRARHDFRKHGRKSKKAEEEHRENQFQNLIRLYSKQQNVEEGLSRKEVEPFEELEEFYKKQSEDRKKLREAEFKKLEERVGKGGGKKVKGTRMEEFELNEEGEPKRTPEELREYRKRQIQKDFQRIPKDIVMQRRIKLQDQMEIDYAGKKRGVPRRKPQAVMTEQFKRKRDEFQQRFDKSLRFLGDHPKDLREVEREIERRFAGGKALRTLSRAALNRIPVELNKEINRLKLEVEKLKPQGKEAVEAMDKELDRLINFRRQVRRIIWNEEDRRASPKVVARELEAKKRESTERFKLARQQLEKSPEFKSKMERDKLKIEGEKLKFYEEKLRMEGDRILSKGIKASYDKAQTVEARGVRGKLQQIAQQKFASKSRGAQIEVLGNLKMALLRNKDMGVRKKMALLNYGLDLVQKAVEAETRVTGAPPRLLKVIADEKSQIQDKFPNMQEVGKEEFNRFFNNPLNFAKGQLNNHKRLSETMMRMEEQVSKAEKRRR